MQLKGQFQGLTAYAAPIIHPTVHTSRNLLGRNRVLAPSSSRSENVLSTTVGRRGTPKLPSTPVSPDSVWLGAARRKHFRNPGEFLSRLAKGQAARSLRLIDRLPIMERDWPHRPLRQQRNRRFAAGLVLRTEVRQVCQKGRNGCHAIGPVRSNNPSRPTFNPTGDVDRKFGR